MISFVNAFLSYLLVMIVFLVLIVAAVLLGKKLREKKDISDALKASEEMENKTSDK